MGEYNGILSDTIKYLLDKVDSGNGNADEQDVSYDKNKK